MTLLMLFAAVLIFALFIWIASIVPVPAKMPWLRTIFYIFIALVAIVLLAQFAGCTDLGLNHSIGVGHRAN